MAALPIAPVPAVYVGDLHPDVSDSSLFDFFSSLGPVASVRVCRDSVSGRSLGYGYVNYISPEHASRAIVDLNHTLLNGKPLRIMWSRRDPDARNSGIGNLFVKNLAETIDNVKLHQIFAPFGNVLSCKVAAHQDGKTKCYGFVQFDSQESANLSISKLNGSIVEGKEIYVANFIKKSERVFPSPDAKYTNLYMKNLDQDITEELIELKFSEFGKIDKVAIAKDANGESKGFGFVSFESPDSAKKAMESMNGVQLGTKTLYVARAQKKAERQEFLKRLYEERRNEQIKKYMASNVYVKNIADDIDDAILGEHFSLCGTIMSAKVMCDDKGLSKGFGFVCFSSPDEASKAVNTLHGCMFHGKPLYVSIAQRKEDRKAQLQLQHAQRIAGLTGSPAAVIPSAYPPVYYPPMSPRQSLYYQPFGVRSGWRPNSFLAPRPAFQSMPLPGMPNTPRQHRQNRSRTNGHVVSQSGQSLSYALQQPSHSPNLSNDSGGQQQRPGQMKYVPNVRQRDLRNGSVPPAASNPQGTEMLSSMLAAASPEQQKQMLGDRLYPLVMKHKFDLAAKITGMLLEMDNSELLLLLESPEALAIKVQEAVDVLEASKSKLGGGQENMQHFSLSAEVAVN
ncbi:polyadenylate-binding protein 4-like isoform X1 [Dioscorea cayenensis subsp. rotundata]|uniref:Polyadenylate-binding protein n=1 Tax=Dioscorea cayennensis subsp. rotundata TaxID=55577 RepID=A0AB40CM65_DIOCR|nr:polyadenylate-binding protein 4-like isoform X1 [Dioscorea cayenensis subsp. rotundata]